MTRSLARALMPPWRCCGASTQYRTWRQSRRFSGLRDRASWQGCSGKKEIDGQKRYGISCYRLAFSEYTLATTSSDSNPPAPIDLSPNHELDLGQAQPSTAI